MLTKKYGKYATFSVSNRIVLTQKQFLERNSIERNYEAQVLSILTPEQQKTYQANILIKRCYDARLNWT
jgi:Spy/CpxP family protein refolding chaperone